MAGRCRRIKYDVIGWVRCRDGNEATGRKKSNNKDKKEFSHDTAAPVWIPIKIIVPLQF